MKRQHGEPRLLQQEGAHMKLNRLTEPDRIMISQKYMSEKPQTGI